MVSESIGHNGDGTPFKYIECEECASMAMPEVWNTRSTPKHGEAAGWQPIETAPSDVPLILHEAGRVFKGGWCEIPFREFRDEDGFYTGQQDADAFWMDYGSGDQCNPTHWQPEQPLPAAPKEPKP